jgi:uncharacterized coiled-coil DUF342 family protein
MDLVFDAEVQEARAKAQEALQDVVTILELVKNATAKSKSIHEVLENSELNAVRAQEIAQSAQSSANNASNMANEIRQEANKTKAEVIKLGNEADKLHLRVNTTDSMIRQYEDRIQQDGDVTGQVDIFLNVLSFASLACLSIIPNSI